MDSMAHPTASGKRGERGFTLAGLIVILTVMMIIVAYAVPRQWSVILQRDRELQTLFIMKQYAIAIDEFERKNKALPVNLDQLKQARAPRFLRGPKAEYADPLTGEVDWLIIPASAALPGIPMKDYAGGPFIGVRPNKNGNSLIEVNGSQKYEKWSYTVNDYRNERNALWASAAKVWQ